MYRGVRGGTASQCHSVVVCCRVSASRRAWWDALTCSADVSVNDFVPSAQWYRAARRSVKRGPVEKRRSADPSDRRCSSADLQIEDYCSTCRLHIARPCIILARVGIYISLACMCVHLNYGIADPADSALS
jgi:hypothetical protein